MSPLSFFATTSRHLESLAAAELHEFGIPTAKETRGGASFEGSMLQAYQACLWSRISSRILLQLKQFNVQNADDLYGNTVDFPWEEHFTTNNTFAVRASTQGRVFNHSGYAALRVKDAIADRFRSIGNTRPNVDPRSPEITIDLHISHNTATLSLDLCGAPLSRRGYRLQQVEAPLRETVAAAMLMRADWPTLSRETPCLLDPMCGSGTLPIEAALIALDLAPALKRTDWGFTHWCGHQEREWQTLINTAQQRAAASKDRQIRITGSDSDPAAIRAARENARRAGLDEALAFSVCAAENVTNAQRCETGLIITNPPYGVRLSDKSELAPVYTRLAANLKRQFLGWSFSIITPLPEAKRWLGLRAHKTHTIYNGALKCALLHYRITSSTTSTDKDRYQQFPPGLWPGGRGR